MHGPLRVLKALYPEGLAVCHHVLVHPPAGLVGGDELALDIELAPGAHALLTTPGATRFYRSRGEEACQSVQARLADGARLEWLPLETLVYDGALAVNQQQFSLAPGAQMFGWDVLALGLPAAAAPFTRGHVRQSVEVTDAWREAGRIAADDVLLRQSPVGLGGRSAMALLWWAAGDSLPAAEVQRALQAAWEAVGSLPAGSAVVAGATQVGPRVVVLRALGERTEPLFDLLKRVRSAWRTALWGLPGGDPRVWS